ncbi:hypothetical protein SAMN05428975_2641 [Mucilaginibacter sp. OK268]|nr:hypothetical protein SAMN05428975_2641 [Mucilaginibacter sp. OK268]
MQIKLFFNEYKDHPFYREITEKNLIISNGCYTIQNRTAQCSVLLQHNISFYIIFYISISYKFGTAIAFKYFN